MILVLFIGMLAVLFSYTESIGANKYGLFLSFVIIFLFSALRYNYGNDYLAYEYLFNEIKYDININIFNNFYPQEIGWLILCKLFSIFNFQIFIFFLSSSSCVIYYCLIKKYVPKSLYFLAIFFYFFTPDFLLLSLSAIRQSFATLIIIISYNYFINKKYLHSLFFISFAFYFHKSSIIVLPLFPLFLYRKPISNKIIFIFTIITFFLFYFEIFDFFINYVIEISINFFSSYIQYGVGEVATVSTGLGVLLFYALAIITLFFEKVQKKNVSFFFKLYIIGILIIPLTFYIPMIGRLDMYFTFSTIIVFPNIIKSINNNIIKYTFSTIVIVFTFYQFLQFFTNETYGNIYSNYDTIFSLLTK